MTTKWLKTTEMHSLTVLETKSETKVLGRAAFPSVLKHRFYFLTAASLVPCKVTHSQTGWLILYIKLAGLRNAQTAEKTLFLVMSVRAFGERD